MEAFFVYDKTVGKEKNTSEGVVSETLQTGIIKVQMGNFYVFCQMISLHLYT